jgi:outer membrane beta-barrel protein
MGTQKNASKYGFAISAIAAIAMSSTALAQGKKGKSAPKLAPAPVQQAAPVPTAPVKGEEKVDISDLESKYWAPKDTDFSVVQNRTFSKDHKVMVTPQWGTPINDPHSDGNIWGATANYFWSERMGVQFTYLKADLWNNSATRDIGRLSASGGARPDFNTLNTYYGLGYTLVPFYAKMSFWGTKIIYFDMAFTPTIGMTQYDQQIEGGNKTKSAFTYGLDVTQYFFFSRWFAVRADLKNQFSSQEFVKYRGTNPPKGSKIEDKMVQDTMFMLGAAFYW